MNMKVLNDVVGYKNLKIYQNTDWFLFSLDSVLLPNFVSLNLKDKVIIDFCSGNAAIPLILSRKTKAQIFAVEIQKDLCDLANESVIYNNLSDQIKVINCDVKNLHTIFQKNSVDVITCNPPYFKYDGKFDFNTDEHKTIARHEKLIKLSDIVATANYLLKNKGRIAIVHRTDRLIEIINLFTSNGFQIKKIRLIYSKSDSESNIVLVEAIKNGGIGLKVLSPLYVHNDDGSYTEEVLKMFGDDNNE